MNFNCFFVVCFLIFIFFLPFSFTQNDNNDNSKQIRSTENQNSSCANRTGGCFNCMLDVNCSYCYGGKNGVEMCLENYQLDLCPTEDPNQATWVGSPNSCPDDCLGPETYDCDHCIPVEQLSCVWCMDGAQCRTGNASGPWGPISQCNDWRYKSFFNNSGEISEICAVFAPCSLYTNCDKCLSNYEADNLYCNWCSSNDTSTGSCVSSNMTSQCQLLTTNFFQLSIN